MQRHQWDEALEDLQRAHSQDPKDTDTIANLIVCNKWLNNDQEVQKYME